MSLYITIKHTDDANKETRRKQIKPKITSALEKIEDSSFINRESGNLYIQVTITNAGMHMITGEAILYRMSELYTREIEGFRITSYNVCYTKLLRKKGDTVHVYPYSMMVEQIKSKGEMSVYYAGDADGRYIFDVEESENFSVEITSGGDVFILKAGDEIRLEKSENNEYWQIANEADESSYNFV